MEWNSTAKIFTDLFDPYYEDDKAFQKSYIYIISKMIDNKRFYKFGFGTRSMKRMNDAQTYLIIGEKNKGYKVNYLFFYDYSPYKREFADYIENEIHKILRHKYERYNVTFASGNKSEWYVPENENSFITECLGLVGVNSPKPREAYKFTKEKRVSILKDIKTKKKYQQYAKDWKDTLEVIKIAKIVSKKEAETTKGNRAYYQKALIGETFKDDKKLWKITDVVYDKSIRRYVVEYELNRKLRKANQQDKMGYETQLVELLKLLPDKQINDLGLADNLTYLINEEEGTV